MTVTQQVPIARLDVSWPSIPEDGLEVKLADEIDRCREAMALLAEIESDLIETLARRVGVGSKVQGPAGEQWHVTRKQGRKEWDHDALHRVLLARGRDARKIDSETGEVLESEGEAVARVLMECAGIGYWRVTNLKRYGVDADEYRHTEPGAVTVKRIEAPAPDPTDPGPAPP